MKNLQTINSKIENLNSKLEKINQEIENNFYHAYEWGYIDEKYQCKKVIGMLTQLAQNYNWDQGSLAEYANELTNQILSANSAKCSTLVSSNNAQRLELAAVVEVLKFIKLLK